MRTAKYAARLVTTAALYAVAGRIGLAIPFTASNVSPIWPASGVALACLLRFGLDCWPAIAAAGFLVNFFSPLPPLAAAGLAVGNTSAAIAGYFLLRRIRGFDISLSRLRDVLGLIAFPAALASVISASFGSSVFSLFGIKPWPTMRPTWLIYYVGDATGILSVAPLLLSLGEWAQPHLARRVLEFSALLVLLAAACLLLFDERLHFAVHDSVLALLVFPFVLWAAIRFGISGTAVTNIVIGSFAVIETARGSGPFSSGDHLTNALLLQFFFATVTISGLLLAAVIAERGNAEAEREEVIRKQAAQEAVLESERRYRLIVEMANQGIWTLDAQNRTTFVNRQFAQMLGYEPEEMLGKSAREFCGDGFPCPSPTEQGREYQLRRKDSSELWGALSATPIPDELHGGDGMLVMVTDMTERKRAEEQVLKSKMELQAVLDHSPAMIYMKDEAGRYTFVNRCWTESFHVDLEEVRGRTDFEIFPETSARQFVANDRKVAASDKALEYEEEVEFEGRLHSYRSIKVALRNGEGKFYALCGISTDITERKAREESLRLVDRALRLLSSCNAAVVHATDEQGLLNEICRLAVEPAGYQMAWIGYAESDEAQTVDPVAFAGPAEGFLDRIHVSWADNAYGRGAVGRAIREGKPVVVNHIRDQQDFAVWRHALETRSFQSVLAVPLRLENSVCGALAIYADEPDAFDSAEVNLISELGENVVHGISSLRAHQERAAALTSLEKARLELEERVRQRTAELVKAKEAAESADHLKSAFLATMSHELRTPLNSIIGFTGVILQRLAGPLNDEQAKQLGMVQNSARHLLALINDVLDISKIESGQLELVYRPFSLSEAIQKVMATVLPLARAKSIALRAEISPAVDWILGDERRTEQILLNLLGNAVKFTDKGEVVLISRREDGWLVMAVRDTGIGIDPQQIANIFEPFRQADSGLARKHEGTGLGLAICKRLVERLGGDISVDSVPGVGSTFTVRLPLELDKTREQDSSGYRG
ncbi:MAG TPA: MASE1 domain-containing protein [Bryobacteraceae bacterium]|nr:MASE1 domain-containing protein [Bryobacteraceae bacterium]